jgi:integrase
MGAAEVDAFLSHLAVEGEVAASTQNQALNAIVFLYKHVLELELGNFDQFTRAKRPRKLPAVLTRDEVARLIETLEQPFWLMATLLYGSGLRLMDCLRLRVKDLDFGYQQIVVRDGKGNKDRVTVLPVSAIEPLRLHLQTVRTLHRQDLANGLGRVWLPHASTASTPMPPANGAGNTCSPPPTSPPIRAQASSAVIMCMRACCNEQSKRRPSELE